MPLHNADIAAVFEEIADLLELGDENPFRIRAYRNAARAGKLPALPGFGEKTAQRIMDAAQACARGARGFGGLTQDQLLRSLSYRLFADRHLAFAHRPIRRTAMSRMLIVAPLAALVLSACVVEPVGRGPGMVVAPALPLIVEIGVEPYYYQNGYHYHYDNNSWRYSNSRSGPWADLPRSHYPKETRFKGRADGRGGDQDRDRRDRR